MNNTRVLELMKLMLYHKEKYYKGEPEISDYAYDAIEAELRKLDPKNPVLEVVGYDIEGVFDYLKD